MKKIILSLIISGMLAVLTACGNEQRTADNMGQMEQKSTEKSGSTKDTGNGESVGKTDGKILVAYFAYSENMGDTSGMSADAISSASLNDSTDNKEGNLQVMAKEIQEKKGADVHQILVEEPYDPDYSTMHDRVDEEQADGTKPALKSKIENLGQYDVIYLGSPVWAGSLPPAMLTFLDENDLSGKTVIPFGIHLGSQFGRNIDQIKEKYPDANVLDGFTINADTPNDEVKSEFDEWLK